MWAHGGSRRSSHARCWGNWRGGKSGESFGIGRETERGCAAVVRPLLVPRIAAHPARRLPRFVAERLAGDRRTAGLPECDPPLAAERRPYDRRAEPCVGPGAPDEQNHAAVEDPGDDGRKDPGERPAVRSGPARAGRGGGGRPAGGVPPSRGTRPGRALRRGGPGDAGKPAGHVSPIALTPAEQPAALLPPPKCARAYARRSSWSSTPVPETIPGER